MPFSRDFKICLNMVARLGPKPTSCGQLAEELDTTITNVYRLAFKLKKAGIVKSVQGTSGGIYRDTFTDALQVLKALKKVPASEGETLYDQALTSVLEALHGYSVKPASEKSNK